MKNILLIGVGGTGSRAANMFAGKMEQNGNQSGNSITSIVFDTDAGDIAKIGFATPITMADSASVGTVCDRIGKQYLREWFPCDNKAIRAQEMVRGASQWRKKSFLAFLNAMNKEASRSAFNSVLEKMTIDPGASCEVYVVASLAGGTGSGSFIPIALYAKRYLREKLGKDPIVNAMLALPDVYAKEQTPENRIKVYANAYAILRELNAINFVARDYNKGRGEQKTAPIKLRIGDPNEPNVGLLFDASDERFWTPQAAPFSQVFLLDKVAGVDSVTANEIVLANSLYMILCTKVGAAFDSEASNHETVRSQNNGSNSIYSTVSTSQVVFPKDSVLNYLAHRKVLDACDKEWMVLHRATEQKIREKQEQAKELGRRYNMKDGEYAALFLESLENLYASSDSSPVIDMVERGTVKYDTNGKRETGGTAQAYWNDVEKYLISLIPSTDSITDAFTPDDDSSKLTEDDVIDYYQKCKNKLTEYYRNCVNIIKSHKSSTVDAILTFDPNKDSSDKLSIVKNLLIHDKHFIHPVAALMQLCKIRSLITEALSNWNEEDNSWDALKNRGTPELPDHLMEITDAGANKKSKSAYLKNGQQRFITSFRDDKNYGSVKTSFKADIEGISVDAVNIATQISTEAQNQLKNNVLSKLAKRIDLLIEKYILFFTRFEKEKEILEEETRTALLVDSKDVDSVINVYSSEENKKKIFDKVFKESMGETEEEIAVADGVSGKGVFDAVYAAAVAAEIKDKDWNEKDSSAYRSLFDSLTASYRDFIAKNDSFASIASYNAVQAIEESCPQKQVSKEMKRVFEKMKALSVPGLQIDNGCEQGDWINPSEITVFMMSKETARYIKRNAERFEISISADNNSEADMMKACAEAFVHKYSGAQSARLEIDESMPDQVIYCTCEIMDITPLRISKINECSGTSGESSLYFRYYRQALRAAKKYDTEMWDPHLGNGWYKRGYLPFMNENMEKECDRKTVKALLYAFMTGKIVYRGGEGITLKNILSFYYQQDGRLTLLKGSDNVIVKKKNIAQIFFWMRNQDDDLIDEWSSLFDLEIQREAETMKNIVSKSEVEIVKSTLTQLPFMKTLTCSLYKDPEYSGSSKSDGGQYGPSVIEFAYMVKTSEESGRDCDDAERILDVAYEVFKYLCSYRANPDSKQDFFIDIYNHEIGKLFEAIENYKIVLDSGFSRKEYRDQIRSWINGRGLFLKIDEKQPIDGAGKVSISQEFAYSKGNGKGDSDTSNDGNEKMEYDS